MVENYFDCWNANVVLSFAKKGIFQKYIEIRHLFEPVFELKICPDSTF